MAVKRRIDPERAEFRRQALRAIFTEKGVTSREAARLAQLPSSNAIGNFLNGHVASLNLETYERLAHGLDLSVSQLIGEDGWTAIKGRRVNLCGTIKTGDWHTQYVWPADAWIGFVVAADFDLNDKSYFLRLDSTEMNEVYPPGTVLEVVDLKDFDRPLVDGNRVVVVTTNPDGFIETSCREIAVIGDGGGTAVCHLITRSTDSRFRDRVLPVAWPIVSIQVTPNGNRVEVRGVVISSRRPEI